MRLQRQSASQSTNMQSLRYVCVRVCVCDLVYVLCVPVGNAPTHTHTHTLNFSLSWTSSASLLSLNFPFAPLLRYFCAFAVPRLLFMLCAALHHYKDLAAAPAPLLPPLSLYLSQTLPLPPFKWRIKY